MMNNVEPILTKDQIEDMIRAERRDYTEGDLREMFPDRTAEERNRLFAAFMMGFRRGIEKLSGAEIFGR